MSTAVQLPHWDMTPFYPGLESPEFEAGFQSVLDKVDALERLMELYDIRPRDEESIDGSTVEAFEAVITFSESLERELHTLYAYIRSFITIDSFDTVAQSKQSTLEQHMVRLSQLDTRITAWIGSLDVEALIAQSTVAGKNAFPLRKTKRQAEHLMSLPEESLASELAPSGGAAWSRLQHNVSSQIMVPLETDSGKQDLPMSVIRNMAFEANRDRRRRAFEAEVAAWSNAAVPLAAALNSIKGETNTIQMRRGWESPLDFALFLTNIDRETLEAMMEAARASFPDFRRYLRAKARSLVLPTLTWYDLFAPVGTAARHWEYEEARDFLLEHFGAYSERLRSFVERAFRENWIDAEPREGKGGGAFCMWLRGDESRVLTNFMPTYDGISTLAHELGHAYHNFNLAGRTMMQRRTPMTLSETASIFCETIIEHAALVRADRQEQLAILEASLQGTC